MENLLLMGIDTRPMVNSALKLDYKTFSISYFKTVDFKMPYKEKHVLDQETVISCGRFEDNYSQDKLFELFDELLCEDGNENSTNKNNENKNENEKLTKKNNENKNENERLTKKNNENSTNKNNENEIDKIVLTTGLNASDFSGKFKKYQKIVRGNKNTKYIDNKFKFYKKLKNKFNVPLTFQPSDVDETCEILQQHPNNQFILKPLQGSGGLGIFLLNYETFNENNNSNQILQNISYENYILQEYVEGINVSSSVLSSHDEQKNLINTRLITEHDLGKNSFEYSGNILPLDENSFEMFNDNQTNFERNNFNINELNKEMKDTSEELIKEFNLIGSNGVDYILDKNGDLKVIEINPRFQGTYEIVESVMDINLLDAHIKACEGEMIEIPPIDRYGVKKIIYARKQVNIGNLNIPNVFDIPYEGVKIEKDQPLVTIISSNENLETAMKDVEIAENEVYKNID